VNFPAQDEYRDSEVEWLGPIPAGWQTSRLRSLVEIKKRIAGVEGPDVLSITQRGIRVRDTESNDGQLAESYAHYQLVEPGDFAMNHMDLLTGWVDVVEQNGVTSPDYRVFSLRNGNSISALFLLYILQHCYTGRIFYAFGQGSSQLGRWRLSTDAFLDFRVPIPPVSEQSLIASFLDRETAKIDALVEEQQRLIELLKEKRQAVISHAVTKGLDPNAPMKDSGVEWLGEVPAHWEVTSLKRFARFRDGERIPLSAEDRGARTGVYPYYGASGIIDHIDNFIFSEDLVLVSEDGANLVNRSTPIAFVATGSYWVNNHAHILKPCDDHLNYWSECIEAVDLAPFVTGAAQPKLTAEALANLIVAVPPASSERRRIAAEIAAARDKYQPLIAQAEAAVTLLQERRAALISAAVTGKIDVRGLASEPAEAEAA
jgi:type I restriction enzyme S subunit